MRTYHGRAAIEDSFVWFTDGDNEVLKAEYCSKCSQEIPDDEVPLLLFRDRGNEQVDIARFHCACAGHLIAEGILVLETK